MAIENVKYIDASLEGSILKYDLDEPLIAGNVNVYQFRISLANIEEAQNSFWNFLLKNDGLFEVNFRSLKTSEIGGEGTAVTLEKTPKENPQYLYCEVPDGSNGGNELYGDYRLEIEVRGSTTVDGKTYKYCTKTMPNPPMVYSSGAFKTSIDLSEETYLRSFMNKFTGGKPGQIMVKRSDSDYDIDWKNTLPNQAIFGGNGTFIESEYQVILTPSAKEVLLERGVIEVTDPDVQLTKVTVDFNKPMDYTGLEFLTTNSGAYTFNDESFTVFTGDKLTSSGYDWGLIKASAVGMDNSQVTYDSLDAPYDNLMNYTVNINGQEVAINLLSLLKNKDLSILRQLSNYAGKIQEIVDTSDDIVHKWRKLGTCFFKVYENSETSDRITTPVGYDGNGFVENYVINGSDELVFQRWISNTGKRFYRSSASVYAKEWPNWTQEFDYGQVLPIENGGTNANTAAGARTNLGVYSQEEIDIKLSDKANLNTTTEQQFKSALAIPTVSVRPIASTAANPMVRFKDIEGIERARLWRGLNNNSNDYFYIQLSSRDATGTDNDKYYWYRLPAPATNPSNSLAFDIYHSGNMIYKTALPTFNKDTYPAGTICLVKVNG